MTTREIANKLVSLCKEGKNFEAIETLYSPNIISTEAVGDETMPARMEGVAAIKEKNQWWFNTNEYISGDLKGPFFNGDDMFTTFMTAHVKNKETGKDHHMQEVCWYKVKDGKIVEERFFYNINE